MTTQEAAAVTPMLFLGDELSIPHVYVYGDGSPAIRSGVTVLTDSEETCMVTLLNLGVPFLEAKERIQRAKIGLPLLEEIDLSDEVVEQMWSEAVVDGR